MPATCKKVNNSGLGESFAVENNTNHFQKVDNEIAEAFVGKFGDKAFLRMRSLLLKQQEIFVSQVWDLHRLQWFQTYLQTSISPPLEENDDLEELNNEARLAKQTPLRTQSTVNNDSNGLDYLVGNGSTGTLEPIDSRSALPKRAYSTLDGTIVPHTTCPLSQRKDIAICEQGPTQIKKFADQVDGDPKVKCEDRETEPDTVGFRENQVVLHKSDQDSTPKQVPPVHGRSSTDQAIGLCFKEQLQIHGLKSANWSKGPRQLDIRLGAKESNDQEVSSSRMNTDASLRFVDLARVWFIKHG